jgi:DNA-binding MarR family transcriptional regulator
MTSVKALSAPAVPAAGEPHVAVLVGVLMQEIRDRFAAEDWGPLRQSHFRLLSNVPREGIRITDLGERLRMTKQASGQFVSALVDTGHLEVCPDPHDARVRVVVRTALGDETVKAFNARILRMERKWAKAVGPERYAEFRRVLQDLGEMLTRPAGQ